MRKFNTYEEAKEYAETLSKTAYEIVLINEDKYLLAGTPMADDALDNAIAECVSKCFAAIGVDLPQEDVFGDPDIIGSMQDCISGIIRDIAEIHDTIYGSEEF